MKTILTWNDRGLARTEPGPVCIYDIAFRPDGLQLIAAAGLRVLVYDTTEGDVIRTLKGHKGTVYCVAYSGDGKRFASGGADNTVVIWKNTMEGLLRYTHNASIQCMCYNPVSMQLVSCTASDFGLWSPEQKSVSKTKVLWKILCCGWSPNGQLLALGHANGMVSIRNKDGQEQARIERGAGCPVWCLCWNPVITEEEKAILAIGDWGQRLAFFTQDGAPVKSHEAEIPLTYDPCSLTFFNNGEYMLIGGSDKKVSLLTRDGVFLGTIAEKEDWVWTCKPRPKQNHVAIGDNSGVVSLHQIVFSTVHGLYQDRYAYREFMTDVVVQNLTSEKKTRVRCHEHVKKIAVYKDKLAVQLPSHIAIYDLITDQETSELKTKLKWKITGEGLDCFLLVVAENHLVLCQERKLQLISFKGVREREWVVDATIRYVRVVGGPAGREGMAVGLKSGLIVEIFLDNPFPVPLIKQTTAVRCLDMSASKKRLAVVDENSQCLVYDLPTKQLLFVEPNASSVAWNADFEDMLAFSGNGMINIKSGMLPTHSQKQQGFVVGFRGSTVYCLHVYAMQSIDVPQSATLYRYIEKKQWENAYAVACLGVTDADWRLLAIEALRVLCMPVATKAFTRIRDLHYIQLIQRIEQQRRLPNHNDLVFQGDIAAYEGKFKEAADFYVQSGNVKMAIDMYSSLHKWNEAKALAASSGTRKGATVSISGPTTLQVPGSSDGAAFKPTKPLTPAGSIQLQVPTTPADTGASNTGTTSTPIVVLTAPNQSTPRTPVMSGSQGAIAAANAVQDTVDVVDLMKKQAKINLDDRNFAAAADLYWEIGDYSKAIEIYGDKGMIDEMYERTRELSNKEVNALSKAATYFSKYRKIDFAVEVLLKISDYQGLARLYVAEAMWDQALQLLKLHPELGEIIHVPYANWLALNDQFEKAQSILVNAGKSAAALQILESLTETAIDTERFDDASYFMWQLAAANLKFLKHPLNQFDTDDTLHYNLFLKYKGLADLYFAYHFIHQYTLQPFTTLDGETIFNVARWLHLSLPESPPKGLRKTYVLYALAKQSRALGAYKLARISYEKLLQLRVPQSWLDKLEIETISVRAKPFSDKDELQPICYRCSATNPLVGKHGTACATCTHPFVFSCWSFEMLPLVEFELADGVDDKMAEIALSRGTGGTTSGKDSARQSDPNVQTMSLDPASAADDDVFASLLERYESGGVTEPLRLGKQELESLRRQEVFIVKQSPLLKTRYFKSVVPETPIVLCPTCNHFFHEEDFELAVIQKGCCPYCRSTDIQS